MDITRLTTWIVPLMQISDILPEGLSWNEAELESGNPLNDSLASLALIGDDLAITLIGTAFIVSSERSSCFAIELSSKVGDGGNRKGGISWGCLTPPLLHRRSDMPCPTITSSS
jgi:hypothetical protein